MGKRKKVMLTVDEDLYREFKVYVLMKFSDVRTFISKALEEAMRLWLEREKKRLGRQSSGK